MFRILVVDDEPVVGAGIIEANSGRYALGIMDLFLSDISGLQAIKSIKAQQPEFPIILVTGKGTPRVFSAARRLGVVGVLNKPFRPEEILELISTALQK
jgi:DNA-binding NarL/FixJ family response regulator